MKCSALTNLAVILLLGCATQKTEKTAYIDANEPEQLSNGELSSLKIQALNHDAKAAFHLYTYYLFAENGTTEAMHWLKVAADYGYPQAEYNLGAFLKESSSVQDQKEAQVWLAKAAKNGVTTPTE